MAGWCWRRQHRIREGVAALLAEVATQSVPAEAGAEIIVPLVGRLASEGMGEQGLSVELPTAALLPPEAAVPRVMERQVAPAPAVS